MLKKVSLAYRFDVENVGLSVSDVLGPFSGPSAEEFGWPGGTESGGWESIGPFEIRIDNVGCVDFVDVEMVRTRPVNPLGWRRVS